MEVVNGLQLAKMKKVDSLHGTAIKFIGVNQLVYKGLLIMRNLGATSWKIDIFSTIA